MGRAKTTEPIEHPFEMVNGVGPRNRELDSRAHWSHLANTVKRLSAAAEWLCHHGWRRGLFPNYFGQSCLSCQRAARHIKVYIHVQTLHYKYNLI